MKFISLCFANVVNIKRFCKKKTEKMTKPFLYVLKKFFLQKHFGTVFVLYLVETKN